MSVLYFIAAMYLMCYHSTKLTWRNNHVYFDMYTASEYV